MKHLLFAALLAMLLAVYPAMAEELTLSVPENISGYGENTILVTAAEAGEIILRVADERNVYRTWSAGTVDAGTTELAWDGLSAWEERLPDGSYTLSAELCAGERSITASMPITVARCKQALLFALPSSDTIYLGGGEKWFAEAALVRAGTIVMDVYAADAPDVLLTSRRKSTDGSEVVKFTWDGRANGKPLPPGGYLLRLYAADNPTYSREITLALAEGAAPVLPLTVTGSLLPSADASDEEIWALMQQPSAVVNIKPTGEQPVYAEPSKRSPVLGTLHGGSQAVEVLEIADGWARIAAWNHESGAPMAGYVPDDRLAMVQPSAEYGLLLDKAAQTLTLFQRGRRVGRVPISTGLMVQNELFRETPAGSFLTLEHLDAFNSEGFRNDDAIHYDGGHSLHQVGGRVLDGQKNYDEQSAELGRKASAGNIRLPKWADGSDFNAYWLWTHLPYHTRLIILDDPAQREMEEAAANAGRVWRPESLSAAALPPLMTPGETEIILTFGGDAVLGTREAWQNKPEALPAVLEEKGMVYPFSGLQAVFAADDMTLINLECVLKDSRAGEDTDKLYRFRGLPSYAEVLTLGSVEQVNIANNHYVDYGEKGKTSTREALVAADVPFSGYGFTWVWEANGHRIGFGGCRETTFKQDSAVISRDIAALRAQKCEVVIYSCHWGTEYSAGRNALQEAMAQAAADAGADIIVGTHPHVVQGVDTVDDALVLYSLGNLMFGGTHDMATFDAVLARVHLRFGSEGYLGCALELLPILTSGSAPLNDFRPILAGDEDARRILMKIQADSGVLLSGMMWFPAREAPVFWRSGE